MKLSDVFVGKELFVGCPNKAGVYVEPVAIGIGPTRIRGSAYIEGPILTGDPTSFAMPEANLMVGRCQNIEAGGPLIPPSIFKVSSRANDPTPIDVMLGDPTGPVGIAVHGLLVNSIVDTYSLHVCPTNIVLGTIFHTGIEELVGTKLLIGAEVIKKVASAVSSEFRVGSKTYVDLMLQIGAILTKGWTHADGAVCQAGHVLSLKKTSPFDMPHPNKKGWRLRHVCIEGPEIAVYCRGRVSGNGVIDLPSYWDGLVNTEDMTINLTPIGSWQELYVKEIQWGKKVIVRNNAGGPINADYHITGRRLDDDLIVEYEGESHTDYPGVDGKGNEGYDFSFENDNMERLVKEVVRERLDERGDK